MWVRARIRRRSVEGNRPWNPLFLLAVISFPLISAWNAGTTTQTDTRIYHSMLAMVNDWMEIII
jgi:hypothetical protein